ncbi:MAG: hypothetical protein HDT13_10755 [Butyrivibrio sp.]|nr:hypothetical protein [Butyrivibrio sp.]
MARHKYKFSNKKHSVGGVISTFMALIAIVLFGCAVVFSFRARGEGGMEVGSFALSALAVAFFGCIMGILSYRESDRYYTFSFIGALINGITAIILIMLFVAGI